MSKFNKLKTHLRLKQAAEYLSQKIDEPVKESDLIEAALRRQLMLSVFIKSYCYGAKGVAEIDEEKFDIFGGNIKYESSIELINDKYFDLAMVGKEVEYIENLLTVLHAAPYKDVAMPVREFELLLKESDNYICLMEEYDKNPDFKGSPAELNRDIQNIYDMGNGLSQQNVEDMEAEQKLEREKYLSVHFNVDHFGETFVASEKFPEDISVQVKISRLDELALSLNASGPAKANDDVNARERNTLLVLLATMCKQANFDYTKRGISKAIEAATEEMGVRVSDDTIRKVLQKIPSALEARSK